MPLISQLQLELPEVPGGAGAARAAVGATRRNIRPSGLPITPQKRRTDDDGIRGDEEDDDNSAASSYAATFMPTASDIRGRYRPFGVNR